MQIEAGGWLLGAAAAGAGAVWLWRHQDEVMTRRPVNEWTFTHMNLLMPTEDVRRGGDVFPLPRRPRPLEVTYGFERRERSLAELHARTNTTSFVVLQGGEIVHESYPGYFAGDDVRFQLFSMTKSVTSMLIGIALDEGAIKDVTDPVTVYCRELVDSAFEGVTIEHLLDMSSGVGDLVEDHTVQDSLISRFTKAATGGGSLHEVVSSAERSTEAGTQFSYSTIDTQVLGWALESATGRSLAQYASERLWSRIGAEHDAYYWLTRKHPRTAIGGGSLNATARDMARLGLLMSRGGELDGQRIVPEEWVVRSRGRGVPHLEVGALGPSGYPHYGYSNKWWTLGGERRPFTAVGIHGQYLYVDPDADVVIVKTSAWPTADDPSRDAETITALRAVADHLHEDHR
ncbi:MULTISPECIES: serine hydrolase [unclassified Streptomyces]|uniref:serine hydrolase domain-containing protein n=1 Tax=unclassified Streptomyces TaxID=2593676 RepID=UPI00225AC301|nr:MULTISPECIES: serine hydrolase [unclassified Streptomyces]MCX5053168.1 beta-lactamase family protein [Streptomyces sp. NBC_00474]